MTSTLPAWIYIKKPIAIVPLCVGSVLAVLVVWFVLSRRSSFSQRKLRICFSRRDPRDRCSLGRNRGASRRWSGLLAERLGLGTRRRGRDQGSRRVGLTPRPATGCRARVFRCRVMGPATDAAARLGDRALRRRSPIRTARRRPLAKRNHRTLHPRSANLFPGAAARGESRLFAEREQN
jgi:hypothetical protein